MLHCPSKEEIIQQLLALLPRGRAWQTHEGGPQPGSVLYQFWLAVAEVFELVSLRACDLRDEFFCATTTEMYDRWMTEYGLPDACDPFPDLCAKVAAIGGTRCEYYAEVAARAGWSIACEDRLTQCGASAGHKMRSKTGRAQPGRRIRAAQLVIRVYTSDSPAFSGRRQTPSKAGRLKAGRALVCPPDINGLKCLLARIIHAEVQTIYEVM
jgi:uncharacterized protein YmfQ (DUF2313 family)